MASTQVGSPLYSAPEVLTFDFFDNSKNFYDSKSDIWSIGCVFYEMLTGRTPFYGTSVVEILNNIKQTASKIAKEIDFKFGLDNFFQKVFILNPKERLDWKEFFSHSIF